MQNYLLKQCFIVLISCGLVACAASENGSTSERFEGSQSGSDCIFEGTIRDYRVLNDSNLLVSGSGTRKYHIELTRPAFGLTTTWKIAFKPQGSRICPGFSEIVVDGNFGPESIRIRSIRRLVPEEYEDFLIRYGKKKPEVEQTREPEEMQGAEVEELD